MEFSSDAKLRLVDGAIAALNGFATKRREMDPWEGHHIAQAIAQMEAGAYALAIRDLTLFAKRPTERDAASEKAIVDLPQRYSAGMLRARLEVVKAALSGAH